ncbi:hypothetical protein [Psychrobacter pygoscelis]|nr:hypothetical protein [Psychrobacter pygoscelis]
MTQALLASLKGYAVFDGSYGKAKDLPKAATLAVIMSGATI